jgi:hypothetical protein
LVQIANFARCIRDKFFTGDLTASWVKITFKIFIIIMSVQTVQFLREVRVVDLGCEYFKISNNVDVFFHRIVFSLHFQERGRGKRKVYSLYTHENVDNCECPLTLFDLVVFSLSIFSSVGMEVLFTAVLNIR